MPFGSVPTGGGVVVVVVVGPVVGVLPVPKILTSVTEFQSLSLLPCPTMRTYLAAVSAKSTVSKPVVAPLDCPEWTVVHEVPVPDTCTSNWACRWSPWYHAIHTSCTVALPPRSNWIHSGSPCADQRVAKFPSRVLAGTLPSCELAVTAVTARSWLPPGSAPRISASVMEFQALSVLPCPTMRRYLPAVSAKSTVSRPVVVPLDCPEWTVVHEVPVPDTCTSNWACRWSPWYHAIHTSCTVALPPRSNWLHSGSPCADQRVAKFPSRVLAGTLPSCELAVTAVTARSWLPPGSAPRISASVMEFQALSVLPCPTMRRYLPAVSAKSTVSKPVVAPLDCPEWTVVHEVPVPDTCTSNWACRWSPWYHAIHTSCTVALPPRSNWIHSGSPCADQRVAKFPSRVLAGTLPSCELAVTAVTARSWLPPGSAPRISASVMEFQALSVLPCPTMRRYLPAVSAKSTVSKPVVAPLDCPEWTVVHEVPVPDTCTSNRACRWSPWYHAIHTSCTVALPPRSNWIHSGSPCADQRVAKFPSRVLAGTLPSCELAVTAVTARSWLPPGSAPRISASVMEFQALSVLPCPTMRRYLPAVSAKSTVSRPVVVPLDCPEWTVVHEVPVPDTCTSNWACRWSPWYHAIHTSCTVALPPRSNWLHSGSPCADQRVAKFPSRVLAGTLPSCELAVTAVTARSWLPPGSAPRISASVMEFQA